MLLRVTDARIRYLAALAATMGIYRCTAESGDSARNFGVTVNPAKSRTFTPAERDRVVVLAES